MELKKLLKLIECPRDAMQGWPQHISTQDKIQYLQLLMDAGFHTIDYGSFVSAKAIPQLADTKAVTEALVKNKTTKLLAIIANVRGAEDAVVHDKIDFLGFPFSISETFQQRNTNSSIAHSFENVKTIQQLCDKHNKQLVIYLSMGFGNPYGDPYNEEVIAEWIDKMRSIGVSIVSIADTVGIATPQQVSRILKSVVPQFDDMEIGVHLHSTKLEMAEKVWAAYDAGCRRFDGAVKGIGGCPMAGNELVGNIDTEDVVNLFESRGVDTGIDHKALAVASAFANRIFYPHGISH